MKNKYHRLTLEEREEISNGLWAGETFTRIAERLGRDISTITREVGNNCKYKRCYRAVRTHQVVMTRRKRQKQPKKLEVNQALNEYVLEKLKLRWSPEEIAKRLKVDYPEDMTMKISHESIYTYLYCLPKGELKKELIRCLRRERNLRRKRKNSHERRGGIADAISISERPVEVAGRTVPGHWEGDLVMGKNHASAIGTLVERTTRYTLLVPLEAKDACSVRLAFARATKKIPRYLKKTLTYDRGKEMAEHKLFTKDTKIQVYFADPCSPWQRGTNENTNGLIRQFFPKGTDFKTVTKKEIRHVQDLLNDRPRKILDFYKPDEIFSKALIH